MQNLNEKFPYIGFWKITKTEYDDKEINKKLSSAESHNLKQLSLNDVVLELRFNNSISLRTNNASTMYRLNSEKIESDQSGLIRWHLPANASKDLLELPLFSCYIFNYEDTMLKINGPDLSFYFDFKITFNKNQDNVDYSVMHLCGNDIIMLTCSRIDVQERFDSNFNFNAMFNNKLLSDCTLTASNGKIFYAHKSILWLTFGERTEQFLNKLSIYRTDSDIVELILHYAYTNCLPDSFSTKQEISDKTLKEFDELARTMEELGELNSLLISYAKTLNFKKNSQIIIDEIQTCFKTVNDYFKCDDRTTKEAGLFGKPLELFQMIKKSVEQMIIAILKTMRLFDMFSLSIGFLSLSNQYEFMSRLANNFHFFITIGKKFFSSLLSQMTHLTEQQTKELTSQLVSEVELIVNFILGIIKDIKAFIIKIVDESEKFINKPDQQLSLFEYLIGKKEITEFAKYKLESQDDLNSLEMKLQSYQLMNQDLKENTAEAFLSEGLDKAKEFLQDFIEHKLKPNEDKKAFDSRLEDYMKVNDFAFDLFLMLFKFKWILDKARLHKSDLGPFMLEVAAQFNSSMLTDEINQLGFGENTSSYLAAADRVIIPSTRDTFFKSGSAWQSPLAIHSAQLLAMSEFNDVELVCSNSRPTRNANKIILASRSKWFYKQLANDPTISQIHLNDNSNVEVFDMLIRYIYTGSLDNEKQPTTSSKRETLQSLVKLANQYEVEGIGIKY